MKFIQQSAFKSISRSDGFVVCLNCCYEMIHLSRTELQLQQRKELGCYNQYIIDNQEEKKLKEIQILQQQQNIVNQFEQTPHFINPNYYQQQQNYNNYIDQISPIVQQNEEIQNSFCSPLKLYVQSSNRIDKKKITKKQSSLKSQQFSFNKRKEYYIPLLKINQKSTKTIRKIKNFENSFIMKIPESKQSIKTSFPELELKEYQFIKDFKSTVLNIQAQYVDLYQIQENLCISIKLDDDFPLSNLRITSCTIFMFLRNNKQNENLTNIEIVANKYGEVILKRPNTTLDYYKFIKIEQDIIEIDDKIKSLVLSMTFLNFGSSDKSLLQLKAANKIEYYKLVKEWAKSLSMRIIHLGSNLITKF